MTKILNTMNAYSLWSDVLQVLLEFVKKERKNFKTWRFYEDFDRRMQRESLRKAKTNVRDTDPIYQTFISEDDMKKITNSKEYSGMENLKGLEIKKGRIKQTFIQQEELEEFKEEIDQNQLMD